MVKKKRGKIEIFPRFLSNILWKTYLIIFKNHARILFSNITTLCVKFYPIVVFAFGSLLPFFPNYPDCFEFIYLITIIGTFNVVVL